MTTPLPPPYGSADPYLGLILRTAAEFLRDLAQVNRMEALGDDAWLDGLEARLATRRPEQPEPGDLARNLLADLIVTPELIPHYRQVFDVPDPDADADRIVIVLSLGPITEQPGSAPPDRTWTVVSPVTGEVIFMFQLGSSQQTRVSVQFRDRRGNEARIDGIPEWMTDNSDVLALEPAEDGRSCLVKAVGPLGVGRLTLSADGDVGTGTRPIIGTVEIEVTAGDATVVQLVPGVPEEQPEEGTGGSPGGGTGGGGGTEEPTPEEPVVEQPAPDEPVVEQPISGLEPNLPGEDDLEPGVTTADETEGFPPRPTAVR